MQAQLARLTPNLSKFLRIGQRTLVKMSAAPGNFESQTKDGWFTELSTMWPGQGMSLKIDEVIFKGRSDFQVRNVVDHWSWSIYTKCIDMAEN